MGRAARHVRDRPGIGAAQFDARLFEREPGLDAEKGSLVFTGVTDDPETLETLARMGFKDPPLAAETVRGWHFGRRAAVQTARAREVLTELVPDLLESLAGSGDPDAALLSFDAALAHMPAAIELFSILRSNARLRDLFGDVLGAAPRLAAIVAKSPHVLDAVIDPRFFGSALDRAAILLTHGEDLAVFRGVGDARVAHVARLGRTAAQQRCQREGRRNQEFHRVPGVPFGL